MNFLAYPLEDMPFVIVTMLAAFTIHEFSHAWTAWKFGDSTAYEQGRVTLNPAAHIDWIGVIFLLIAGFGWAKPVPVRRGRFRHPRLMSIAVTAAGPISNLLLAFIGLLIVYVLVHLGIIGHPSEAALEKFGLFMAYWLYINVILFLFNLIPLPPLDGYRIVEEFASVRLRIRMAQNEQWGIFVFLLLVILPPLRDITIDPLFSLAEPIVRGMNDLLVALFGSKDDGSVIASIFRWRFS